MRRFNAFLRSPGYVLMIALMTILCYCCSAELWVYSSFVLIGLGISLFGDDYLAIMPIVACAYISPSAANNPGVSTSSIFYPGNGGGFILALVVVFFASVVVRLTCDRCIGGWGFLKAKRQLMPGILALGISYLLGGIGSGHYFDRGLSNLLFASIQFVAVFFMYWLFAGAVCWERVEKRYFPWIGFGYGMVILCEVAHIYLTGNLVRPDGVIEIGNISTGWGNANNVGAMLAMAIPFAWYLACTEKKGWIYNLCASAMLLGVVFTSSRTAILGAGLGYGVGFIACWLYARKEGDRANQIVHLLTVGLVLAAVVVLWDKLLRMFTIMIDKGFDSSRRDVTYIAGLKQWLQYPIFGGTFYPVTFSPETWMEVAEFSAFFPPRWHNTIVQMLACCGGVGMAAYGFHRYQTIRLVKERKQTFVNVIGFSLLLLLLMSLLDCHFFNVGPTLFYSMALAFMEKCPGENMNIHN